MRVLFTTYPERSHFLAMAPMAWALRTAGHEVCFASQPKFVDLITQAGLTAVPIGSNRDLWQIMDKDLEWLAVGMNGIPMPYDAADWPEKQTTWDYVKDGYDIHVPRWHKMSNVPMIPDLVAFARHWQPDLVVWEPSTYAGAVAAEACGAAHARLLFSLDTYGVVRERFLRLNRARPADQRADPLADWLAPYGAKYGFEYSEDLVTGHFTITHVPPSLSVEAETHRYLPVRYVPYGGRAVLPDWLRVQPERPRVAITMGLSTSEVTGYAIDLPDLFAGLADLDAEVVATLSQTAQETISTVPDNVRLVPFAPLHALIPTCTAVMHHGGFGTMTTTALHGKPHLVVPWNADGPAFAQKIAAQGAGLSLHVAQSSGAIVRGRLHRLLTEPKFQHGANRLRDETLAMPTPNEAVGDIEKLVAEFRRAPRPTAGRS